MPFLAALQYSFGKSAHYLSCSFIFFHFLSLSFIFFPFLFPFFLLVRLFSRVLNILFFLPGLPHEFLLELLCKKSFFWAVSGGTPLAPLFFSSIFHVFFFSFSFAFSIAFHVFHFSFVFFIFLFIYFPSVCLFKNVSSFFILFLFFLFSGAQNLWRHYRIPWGKSSFSFSFTFSFSFSFSCSCS